MVVTLRMVQKSLFSVPSSSLQTVIKYIIVSIEEYQYWFQSPYLTRCLQNEKAGWLEIHLRFPQSYGNEREGVTGKGVICINISCLLPPFLSQK